MDLPLTTITRRRYIEHELKLHVTPSNYTKSDGQLLLLEFTLQDVSTLRFSRGQPPITTGKPTTTITRCCPALILRARWSHLARNALSRLGLELNFHNEVMLALHSRVNNIVNRIGNTNVVVSIKFNLRRINETTIDKPFELFKEFYKIERVKLIKKNDDSNCAICLEDLVEEVVDEDEDDKKEIKRAVKLQPCGHVFHEDCVLNWFYDSDLCPLCRSCTWNF